MMDAEATKVNYKFIRSNRNQKDFGQKIIKAAKILSDVLEETLGPGGRNTLIDRRFRAPEVFSDGASIAKEIRSADPFEDLIIRTMTETSSQTNMSVGDGTTTSNLLATALVKAALSDPNLDRMKFVSELNRKIPSILKKIRLHARKIRPNSRYIRHVAALSAHDEEMGRVVAEVIQNVGAEGIVQVERVVGEAKYDYTLTDGYKLQEGFISPKFLGNINSTEVVMEDAHVVVIGEVLSDLTPYTKFLKGAASTQTPILFLVHGISGDVADILVNNLYRGVNRVCVVQTPGNNHEKERLAGDLAAFCGATLIKGDLEFFDPDFSGKCGKVRVDASSTELIDGHSDERLEATITQLKAAMERSKSNYDKRAFRDRIAALTRGVAIIQVGGSTESEMVEKIQRVEDSILATQSAVVSGIAPGGGVVLYKIAQELEDSRNLGELSDDGVTLEEELPLKTRVLKNISYSDQVRKSKSIVVESLIEAFKRPLSIICRNAGQNQDEVEEEIRQNGLPRGFNAETGEFGDMFKMGVVDPVKVIEYSVLNAISVASLLINTSVAVVNYPESYDPCENGRIYDELA